MKDRRRNRVRKKYEPMIEGEKNCAQCFTLKHVLDFSIRRDSSDGRNRICKSCACDNAKTDRDLNPVKFRERNRAYRGSNLEKVRAYLKDKNLQRDHGITLADFQRILERQEGRCAICKCVPRGKNIHLDHDHLTGKIRGILCVRCNAGLGMFRDDPENMRRACEYLEGPPIILTGENLSLIFSEPFKKEVADAVIDSFTEREM